MTTTTNAFIANVCAASDEMVAYTPPAAPAAPAEHAQTLNKLLNDFARACTFGDDAFARMAASKAIHGHYASLASQTAAPALSEHVGEVATDGGIDWVLDGPADWAPGTKVYLAAPNQTPAPAAQGLTDAQLDAGVDGWFSANPSLEHNFRERMRLAILAASRTTPKDGAS